MTGLYTDPETGKLISTHSMLKSFRRCPKMTQYKYVERLKPKVLGRPLRLGTWMHKLEEVHSKGGDWREVHADLTAQFSKLFDEEKDDIGDLPRDCERLWLSYLWHYANDVWKIIDTEFVLEVTLPDGNIYRCKIDNLVENQYGLWVVDHKWHRTLPNLDFRILDSQSALYIWAALQNKIPVQGHIWNYGRSKPPTMPSLTKTGLVSRWDRCDTDFPTAVRFFKEHFPNGIPQRYKPKLRYLRGLQYVPGEPQNSAFFRRSILEKSNAMVKQVAQEGYHTHKRMHEYPFDRPEIVERVPDRSCTYMCNFVGLCTAELFTGSRPVNWKHRFTEGDPMDYYYDDREEKEER